MSAELQRERLRQQLIRHEGLMLKPYTDTVGKLTIGVGRNLTDNGISKEEAFTLLDHDIDQAVVDIMRTFPWAANLDPVRKAVLIDLSFNLGIAKLREFKTTMQAFSRGDYATASDALGKSKWATQVGQRSVTLRRMLDTGEFPDWLSA